MSPDGAIAEPTPERESALPAIVAVRTRVVEGSREAVVVEFANGAQVRYRDREADIEEVWVPPGTDPADATVRHDRDADAGVEAVALRLVGEYLSFDDRSRAAFVWGTENTAALLGD
jgi:hypothetical protein